MNEIMTKHKIAEEALEFGMPQENVQRFSQAILDLFQPKWLSAPDSDGWWWFIGIERIPNPDGKGWSAEIPINAQPLKVEIKSTGNYVENDGFLTEIDNFVGKWQKAIVPRGEMK